VGAAASESLASFSSRHERHQQHHSEFTLATKVKFTSPFGTAQYPHLSSPDTVGKYADNKYKTKLTLPAGDPSAQAFIKVINDAAVAAHGPSGLKSHMHRPYVEDAEANTVTFTFKTAYQPPIFDGRGKPIPSKVRVGGGSVLRIMGVIVDYEKGVSAQISQVQVKELNGPGVCAFDTVDDGYVYEADDEPEADTPPTEGGAPNGALDI
jgi:hypothetical protein